MEAGPGECDRKVTVADAIPFAKKDHACGAGTGSGYYVTRHPLTDKREWHLCPCAKKGFRKANAGKFLVDNDGGFFWIRDHAPPLTEPKTQAESATAAAPATQQASEARQ